MTNNIKKYHRRSIRLKEYDYTQAGAYFITICTYNHRFLFGVVEEGKMLLNRFGKIVESEWLKTEQIRENIELDEYIIMPNHFHGIIIITDTVRGTVHEDNTVGAYSNTPLRKNSFRSPSRTIGAIVRGFKSAVTKCINEYRETPGFPIWQRNYYEHIIRSREELSCIREYIANNPLQWQFDRENPHYIQDEEYEENWREVEKMIYGRRGVSHTPKKKRM